MGAEIKKYHVIDEIYDVVIREDIVVDYIAQTQTILCKFGVTPVCEDYPEALYPFMGRKIWKDLINSINSHPEKWGVFVKPVKDKAFTRHVINEPRDLIGCEKQQTIFLEMNDGYALGNYGLQPILYAKLISARWSQLLGREDAFDFRN